MNTFSLAEIRHVRVGTTDTAIVLGTDVRGIPTEFIIKAADIPKVVGPLLCCAAVSAADPTTGKKPLPGSIIPGCSLPVMKWGTGREINGEPFLLLELPGGGALRFQFPAQAANECGLALAKEGYDANLATPTRTN
jgi:hypothetical protein